VTHNVNSKPDTAGLIAFFISLLREVLSVIGQVPERQYCRFNLYGC